MIVLAIGLLFFIPTWIAITVASVPLQIILFGSMQPKSEASCYKEQPQLSDIADCNDVRQENLVLASSRQNGIMAIGSFNRGLELFFIGLAGYVSAFVIKKYMKTVADMGFGLRAAILFSLGSLPILLLSIGLTTLSNWLLGVATLVEGIGYLIMNAAALYSGFAIANARQRTIGGAQPSKN